MAEAGSVVTIRGPEGHRQGDTYLRSTGTPLTGVELSIRDPSGRTLPAGETGEVCVRGANIMVEYWRQTEATAAALRDGWYQTGMPDDGRLPLLDGPGEGNDRDWRRERVLDGGGERLGQPPCRPADGGHRHSARAVGRGGPCRRRPLLGEVVTEEELTAHAREWIAGYKVPRTIEFRSEPLPLSGAMKVLKRELRVPYWSDRERTIN